MLTRGRSAIVVLSATLVAGCGLAEPNEDRRGADRSEDQRPSSSVAAPLLIEKNPKELFQGAAEMTGNWTLRNLDAAYARVIDFSIREARRDLQGHAAEIRNGVAQLSTGVRSTATVKAVIVRGVGDVRRGIIVTREAIIGGGVPGEGHEYQVTLATAKRFDEGWAISRWSPQP